MFQIIDLFCLKHIACPASGTFMPEQAPQIAWSMMLSFFIHIPALIIKIYRVGALKISIKLSKDSTRGVEYYHPKK
jgi:hypothetical protein